MKLKRTQDPQIIKYLLPYFTEDGGFTRDIIAKELFNMMISASDKIFVVIIFEEKELYGFGISYVPDNREYVWLAQAYFKSGSDRNYGRKAIEMIKQWAIEEFNIHEMRFETNRNPKAIERVWDFLIHAHVMSCNF